eukprot:1157971-Pelagomonas_calceolata.AAC.1
MQGHGSHATITCTFEALLHTACAPVRGHPRAAVIPVVANGLPVVSGAQDRPTTLQDVSSARSCTAGVVVGVG